MKSPLEPTGTPEGFTHHVLQFEGNRYNLGVLKSRGTAYVHVSHTGDSFDTNVEAYDKWLDSIFREVMRSGHRLALCDDQGTVLIPKGAQK